MELQNISESGVYICINLRYVRKRDIKLKFQRRYTLKFKSNIN